MFLALSELTARAPWRSENEAAYITSLLRDAETEIRPNTVLDIVDPNREYAVIAPAAADAPVPTAPGSVAPAFDYDKLAEAMLRAQARAAGTALPTDGTAVTPPPPVAGAVEAPATFLPPVAPDIPAPSNVFA
jgi:hypothetical protein